MRRPRDYDSELKALDDKAKRLKKRKVMQLGELVVATGADVLPVEELTGALLVAAETTDFVTKEEWRRHGAGFFRGKTRRDARGDHRQSESHAPRDGRAPSPAGEASP